MVEIVECSLSTRLLHCTCDVCLNDVQMKEGKYAEGELVLRAKIDMASPNLNMRDPALFRIKHEAHQATGEDWCIYPMYDFSHPISDAVENITHSLCTLEFEDHRPFYDWVIEKLLPTGLITAEPQQIEFSRLNIKCVWRVRFASFICVWFELMLSDYLRLLLQVHRFI